MILKRALLFVLTLTGVAVFQAAAIATPLRLSSPQISDGNTLPQSMVYSVFVKFVVFPLQSIFSYDVLTLLYVNMLASNHPTKLINTDTSACYSNLNR